MKIQTSQIQLSGQQQESIKATRLERLSVSALEQAADGGVGGRSVETGQGDERASIHLSLTSTVSEQQAVETQSRISDLDQGQTMQEHAGLKIADSVIKQTAELELWVSEIARPEPVVNDNNLMVNGVEIAAGQSLDVKVEVVSLLTQESEQNLTFEALGQVTTEDGRGIDFMLALDFQRSSKSEQINQFVGNRNLIDPLMINLSGGAVEFSDLTFEFDLNADGEMETLSQTASGSGFIVFDKNQNGLIDDGTEMFGPQSGQGFDELREYDDDGNGWIDENDAIYGQLGVMSFNGAGNNDGREVQSLMSAEVGAIYLGSVASDYQLNTESGMFAGSLKQSGIALAEDGRALLMQEVHLVDHKAQLAQPVTEVITDFDLEPIAVEEVLIGQSANNSPLNLFQFDQTLLNARDAQTQVSITSSQSFNVEARFQIENTQGFKQPQLEERLTQVQDLRNWVSEAMKDFEVRDNSGQASIKAPAIEEIRQAKSPIKESMLEGMDLDSMKLDAKLSAMRSMVESLREMRQMSAHSEQRASTYKTIGYYK